MKDKKSLISKCLLGGGLLALICGIFCFFGSAFTITIPDLGFEYIPAGTFACKNLFSFILGLKATLTGGNMEPTESDVAMDVVGGTTALFVIELIIIVLAVILLIGIFAKKLQKKYITIGSCVVCVLAIVTVVLAFCSKKMILDSNGATLESIKMLEAIGGKFSLGSAGISYGVLGIVGILATGAGLFLGKDQAIGA